MSEQRRLDAGEARAILEWYLEAGVDEAVGDTPVDRLGAGRSDVPAAGETATAGAAAAQGAWPGHEAQGAGDPVLEARRRASAAASIEELHNLLAAFEGCPLRYTAKSLCFADGNPKARVMFVGEAPGAEEDLQGKPFVGRAGQLLDRMLAAIGLDRTSAYITNTVYWRPPGNRTPTPPEMQACRPFVDRLIELADPDILVFLGGAAAKELLGRPEGILKLRGRWFDYDTGTRKIAAIATLHPAYLLRQPGQKRLAWRDMLAIRKALDQ